MRANDAIAGLVLVLVSAAMIAYTTTFPSFMGQRYGPALFPRILGTGLIVCGVLLIWRGLAARSAGAPWLERDAWVQDRARVIGFVLVPVMLVFYILASETIGFIPIAIVFLAVLLLWLRARPIVAFATAVVTTFAMQWFFGTMLRVPLPRGLLTDLM